MAIPNVLDQRFVQARRSSPHCSDPNRFRFLNVAMLTEKKGHADLLHAYARAFGGDDSVELRIAGDGPLRSTLQTLAEELGVENRVVFCGMLTRDEIVEEMLSASAFVLASHYETFGVVVAEALACGLPVVATRCGGPEFIVRDKDGLLVPPGDPAALAAALRQTRAMTPGRDSEEIRSACIARFGETTVVRAIVAEYMKVLQSGGAVPVPGGGAGDVRHEDE